MSRINELLKQIEKLEKELRKRNIFVPLPEEEFGHLTKQRDKLTGNTKSGKKKLKNAQEKYLSSRESQLKELLRKANKDQEESSAELEKSPSHDVYDW